MASPEGSANNAPLTKEDVAWILRVLDESPFDVIDLRVGDFVLRARMAGAPAFESAPPAPAPAPAAAPPASAPADPRADAPPAPAPAPAESRSLASAGHELPPDAEGMFAVRAPTVGTFYRAPEPGAEPYVREGVHVDVDTTIGLVEVMKMFNAVPAGVSGTVRHILIEDAAPVEFDQALMLIEPD